jgi:hypothetical protein
MLCSRSHPVSNRLPSLKKAMNIFPEKGGEGHWLPVWEMCVSKGYHFARPIALFPNTNPGWLA